MSQQSAFLFVTWAETHMKSTPALTEFRLHSKIHQKAIVSVTSPDLLSCEYSSQWSGMRVVFKTDASAQQKGTKTPATETNEAFALSLAVCELQIMKATVPVQTIVLWSYELINIPTMKALMQHSFLWAHTHARNLPSLQERRTLKQSEMRKTLRLLVKLKLKFNFSRWYWRIIVHITLSRNYPEDFWVASQA